LSIARERLVHSQLHSPIFEDRAESLKQASLAPEEEQVSICCLKAKSPLCSIARVTFKRSKMHKSQARACEYLEENRHLVLDAVKTLDLQVIDWACKHVVIVKQVETTFFGVPV
jgi:hypothetical protein